MTNKHWDGYQQARWYGTTPLCGGHDEIGLFLEVGGQVVRYRLSAQCARHIADSLAERLGPDRNYRGERSQSTTSCGSPSSDVSTPDDGEKV